MKQPVTFYSEGCKLTGDLYLPEGLRPKERHAGVVELQTGGGFGLRLVRKRHWNHRDRDSADSPSTSSRTPLSGTQPARRQPSGPTRPSALYLYTLCRHLRLAGGHQPGVLKTIQRYSRPPVRTSRTIKSRMMAPIVE